MRVVLDTNVLISGIFFSGPPYEILDAWRHRRIELVTSPEILGEYTRVALELQSEFPQVDPHPVLGLVMMRSHLVQPTPLPEPVCDDPHDDKFLACAVSSGARIVVSGDKALLRCSGYEGVAVLTPRRFASEHLRK
jgi:putative PIN family toxin of toxin-antitoxin system